MNVSQALQTRITCRAFLDTPVSRETVRAILEQATRAPSGGNLQPYYVWALAGRDLSELEAIVLEKFDAGQLGDGATEYNIYPPEMKEPYIARKFRNGQAVYAALGISRDDANERRNQIRRNFEFFGAPVGLFFAIDRSMQQGQWADMGMYLQSIMLLAREYGLDTSPLQSWALWPETVGNFLQIPSELMLYCGMGLGVMDRDHPVNGARVPRAGIDEISVMRGFA